MGKIIYLRPSSDTSLGHSCSSGSSGYAMINEEVKDDDSTYIYQSITSTSTKSASSTFAVTGSIPAVSGATIDSAVLVAYARYNDGSNNTYDGTISTTINGTSYSGDLTLNSSYAQTSVTLPTSGFAAGQSYNLAVTIATSGSKYKSSSDDGTIRITQVYIKITYSATLTVTGTNFGDGTITYPSTIDLGDTLTVRFSKMPKLFIFNGNDQTSNIVQTTEISYKVEDVSGASYNFELNSSGYYESTNQGQSQSAALCKVSFTTYSSTTVVFHVINYAEATYDYGILGNLDSTLGTTYTKDDNYYWAGDTEAKNKSTEQEVSYTVSTAGSHYIYVKFRKDQQTSSNNDSLQFRITSTASETLYKYEEDITTNTTMSNYFQLVYQKQNGSWVRFNKIYKKVNGSWVEQTGNPTALFSNDYLYKTTYI